MAQQQQQLQLGQETVPFALLARRAAEDAFTSLKEICEAAPEQSDSEKKISLLKFILKTRQRLLRLYVICKWCRQIPLVERCQQVVGTLSNHDMSFTQAADSLFYLHESLQVSRAPMYDVPSAADVLLTGGFHRLPKCIEELDRQPVLEDEKKGAAIEKLDTLLRSKLLDIQVPREFTSVTVRDGRLVLRVEGEFQVELTLGYRGIASLWRVLHLELLVGEPSGPATFSDRQRLALGDDLERRMAPLENPFGIIYTVLHEFCAALVMDTLCRQVRGLQQGRWREALRLDLSFDSSGQQQQQQVQGDAEEGLKTRVHCLKITYWLDLAKPGGSDAGLPSLRIEPGSEQQIACLHQPPVVDPNTGNDAEFVLNQSCVDVEKLILKAINCNIHSRLVDIKRSLQSNVNLCRGDADVFLKAHGAQNPVEQEDLGNVCLYLRAYADVYICLGINIRNGRFIFRSPMFLPSSALQEMEEALNQGTMSPVDVFANLRSKSIICHFASLGSSINLKAYEPGAISFKFPDESFKIGSNVLVLGFPNSGDVYFLMMQLDQAFMPLFVLVEGEKQSSSSRPASRQIVALNRMIIDTEKCFLTGDDANLSLLGGKPRSSRDAMVKPMESKPGLTPAATRIGKVEQTGFLTGQWQRSPLHASPSASSMSSPPPRTGFGGQSSMFHSRKSSSANNLLALVPQSPARSSVNRNSPSSKLPEMDYVRSSRSPLQHDTAPVSPDLDDEHLSKLIESISGGAESLAPSGSRHLHPAGRMTRPSSKSLKASSPHRMELLDEGRSPSHLHLSSPPRQRHQQVKRKPDSDILSSLPSLQRLSYGARKKLKSEDQTGALECFLGQSYSAIATAAGQGKAPLASHMTILIHVVKSCWLAIKHARLTNQLRALGISFHEEGGHASSKSLIFRLPASGIIGDMKPFCNDWQRLYLSMGKPGSEGWEVKLQDPHYRELWNLQKQKAMEWGCGVQFAALSEADAHIKCSQEGLILAYNTVEDDSVRKLMRDLDRLRSARAFSLCMKSLLEAARNVGGSQKLDAKWESISRAFKVEAVGLTSLWFSYSGSMPGMLARFVVEWGAGQQGCIVHVSPEQLWPHTKYLEDYINGGDVELLLDAIRITAGPLQSLAGAIRPARAPVTAPATSSGRPITPTQASSPNVSAAAGTPSRGATPSLSPAQSTPAPGPQGRAGPGPGIVPSSLLPTDISVLMRSPYWIRIVYRKQFAVDMRCFEGDQVWLQPAPPPQGAGPEAGGSLPCPQFRPFVMENVAVGLNNPETGPVNGQALALASGLGQAPPPASARPGSAAGRTTASPSAAPAPAMSNGNNASSAAAQAITGLSIVPGRSLVIGGPAGVYPGYRGELNSAFCAMSDDGGYGGAWVPLAALKKVLRSTLKYLGVLWLFAQFPGIIREVLGAIMNGKDGTLLHLDAEQPALRFNIGNCMFAVNMHRHSLYLQGVDVRKFQNQPQQAQAQGSGADADLTSAEMTEIADFFAHRVTSEPYDASRLASFVTILTLPFAVLREFLGLISWKKEAQKSQGSDSPPRPRIELCMENRAVSEAPSSSSARSSIVHDRERGNVEFGLQVLLDMGCVPQGNVNVAGGAGWLPQCVSVKLRYQYSDGGRLVMRAMEGSHGGKACWSRGDEWERLKERTMVAVDVAAGQEGGGRIRAVAEAVQSTFQSALHQLRGV